MAAEEDKLAGWMDEGGTAPAGDPPPADPGSEAGAGEFVPVDPPPAEGGADAGLGDFVPVDPPPPEEAPPEAAPQPEIRKPASGVRRGGTGKIGARPRPAGGTRPALAPPPKSKLTKYLALTILILIPALIGVGIWRGVWTKLLQEAGLVAKPVVSKPPPPKVETELDQQFRQAETYFATVDAFVAGELKAFEDKHASEKPAYEELKTFVEKLDRLRGEATRAMEPLAKVNDEAAKPEAIRRLTIEPAPIQERHRKAQEAIDKIIASAGAWEKVLREIRPKHAPSSSQVTLRPLEPALLGFWAAAAPGQWFRLRSTRTAGGRETVAHEDTIVDGLEQGVVKGRRIDGRGARTFETPQAPSDPTLGAEEKVEVGGTSYVVQVVELSEEGTKRKDWICRDPIALNLLPLRREQDGATWVAVSMGADTLMIGDRSISCVLVEYDESPAGGTPARSKVWYSWSVPGRVAKRETPELREEIVAFGPDSGEIPPFPTAEIPSPEPTPSPSESPSPLASPEPTPTPTPTPSVPPPPDPKEIARERLEVANGKLAEATPLYKEVAEALNDLPEDAEALKALIGKGEAAATLLGEAETIYRENRDLAPDPGVVDKRIAGIGKLQERLKGYLETLRSKLK